MWRSMTYNYMGINKRTYCWTHARTTFTRRCHALEPEKEATKISMHMVQTINCQGPDHIKHIN